MLPTMYINHIGMDIAIGMLIIFVIIIIESLNFLSVNDSCQQTIR